MIVKLSFTNFSHVILGTVWERTGSWLGMLLFFSCSVVSDSFSDPMDCSLPCPSVHVISQASILEKVAISFSRGSSPPRDQTRVSCFGRRILYYWATWESLSITASWPVTEMTVVEAWHIFSFFNISTCLFVYASQFLFLSFLFSYKLLGVKFIKVVGG